MVHGHDGDLRIIAGVYDRAAEALLKQKARVEALLDDPGAVLTGLYDYGSDRPWYDLTMAPLDWRLDGGKEFGYHRFQEVVAAVLQSHLVESIDPSLTVSLAQPRSYPSAMLILTGCWSLAVVDLMRRTWCPKPPRSAGELLEDKERYIAAIASAREKAGVVAKAAKAQADELSRSPFRYAFRHPERTWLGRVQTFFLLTFRRRIVVGKVIDNVTKRAEKDRERIESKMRDLEKRLAETEDTIRSMETDSPQVNELTTRLRGLFKASGYRELGQEESRFQ